MMPNTARFFFCLSPVSVSLSSPPLTLHFSSPFCLLPLHSLSHSHSGSPRLPASLPPSRSLFSGWVPAVGLVALVAGVTARLSVVAGDQGGRLAARTMGAERLRLTAGHLSRAISVGAEARSPLVGPAYCEDQRQSVSLSLTRSRVSSASSSTHLPTTSSPSSRCPPPNLSLSTAPLSI